MKKLFFTLLLSVLAPAIPTTGLAQGTTVTEKTPIWVDVRTAEEYNIEHLKNAVLLPYDTISQKILTVTSNKKQAINLYCRSGRRAEIARRTLEKMGFTNVQNLGALQDLKIQGMKVAKK